MGNNELESRQTRWEEVQCLKDLATKLNQFKMCKNSNEHHLCLHIFPILTYIPLPCGSVQEEQNKGETEPEMLSIQNYLQLNCVWFSNIHHYC